MKKNLTWTVLALSLAFKPLHAQTVETIHSQAAEFSALSETLKFKSSVQAASMTLVSSVNLEGLAEKHLKAAKVTIGGKTIWLSTVINPDKYILSVLVEGRAVAYYSLADLITKPSIVELESGRYKLIIAVDMNDPMFSEVVLRNVTDKKDEARVDLQTIQNELFKTALDANFHGFQVLHFDGTNGSDSDLLVFVHPRKTMATT